MNSLLYEIAADAWELSRTSLDYGYWRLRTHGLTEGDIRHATVTAASLGAFMLTSASFPEARHQFSLAVLPIFDDGIIWIFKQRWMTAVRKGLLISTAIGSAILLLLTPSTRSQSQSEPFSIPAVVSRHDTDIAALKSAMQEMRADMRSLKENQDGFFWWMKGIGVAALTTIVGLNVTRYHQDARRGRAERERAERSHSKPAARRREDNEAD